MFVIDLLGNEVQELYKSDAIKQLSLKLKSKQGKSVSKSFSHVKCHFITYL